MICWLNSCVFAHQQARLVQGTLSPLNVACSLSTIPVGVLVESKPSCILELCFLWGPEPRGHGCWLKEEPPKWQCLIVLLVSPPTNPKKARLRRKESPRFLSLFGLLPFWVPWVPPAVPPGQPLTIFSPKAGPMKDDFEKLGLEVSIVDAWTR